MDAPTTSIDRICLAAQREALSVLSEGVVSAAEIDEGFKELFEAREGPCRIMDHIGLDKVVHTQQTFGKERNLPVSVLEWLTQNYINLGKLGTKSDLGGLYPKPPKGSRTRLIFLNVGRSEPLYTAKTMAETMHRGQVLTLDVDEGGQATEIVGGEYNPDGL